MIVLSAAGGQANTRIDELCDATATTVLNCAGATTIVGSQVGGVLLVRAVRAS